MPLTLETLAENYVFESSPTRHDLGAFHVPFDDLMEGSNTEVRLRNGTMRREPTALIGTSGSGKSSVIAHVLGPLAEDLAPLVVPLAAVSSDVIESPDRLADHLLDMIRRIANSDARRFDSELETGTTTITRTQRGGVGFRWRWLSGDLAREVQRQVQIETRATLVDKTDVLTKALEAVAVQELQPVLVFDDTDRWLGNSGSEMVGRFFGEGLRWLLELPASLVVAVHPRYFELASRPEVMQYLDTQIEIPRLDKSSAIEAILSRRVETCAEINNPNLSQVLLPGASEAILNVYKMSHSVRRALHVCHTALHEAISDGAPMIGPRHIMAAANAG